MLLLLLSRFSRVRLCETAAAHEAPLFLGFSRQEYWSGLPFPSPMVDYARHYQECVWKRPIKPKSYIVMVQCLASFRIKLEIRIKLIILSSWDMPIFMRVVCNTVYVLSYVLIQ